MIRTASATRATARRAVPVSMRLATCTAAALLGGCDDKPARPSVDVPQLALTEVSRLQSATPFGRVADLEIGADGSVFVLDALARSVRVFDEDGRELRTLGRPGEGPGEFLGPDRLLWGPEGNLWVLDLANGRLTEFTPGGDLMATYHPVDLPIVFPFALGFAAPGTLRWVGITSPDLSNLSASWLETRLADGRIEATSEIALPFVEWPLLFERHGDGATTVLPVPFSGEPMFRFDRTGRLWYTHTARPQVHRWSETGAFDLTVARDPTPPRVVTAADRDSVLAGAEYDQLREGFGQAAIADLSAMIPGTKPTLAGFFFDDRDQLWVVRGVDESSQLRESSIEIYDREGMLAATAHAALAAVPTPRMRNGMLAAVIRDELDVESVVLYRIQR